jgi:hypothetical protein
MSRKTKAEVHVLDRLKYLLGEQSVERLIDEDSEFGVFVEGLYATLENKSHQLRQSQ